LVPRSCGRTTLYVLFGAKVPFLLRKCGDYYNLVRECYVHGIMHGEAMEMLKEGKLIEQLFELI
jgi:hypothetical protein